MLCVFKIMECSRAFRNFLPIIYFGSFPVSKVLGQFFSRPLESPYLEAKLVNRIICKSRLWANIHEQFSCEERRESDCSRLYKQNDQTSSQFLPSIHTEALALEKKRTQKTWNSPTSEIIFFVLPQKGLLLSLKFFRRKVFLFHQTNDS